MSTADASGAGTHGHGRAPGAEQRQLSTASPGTDARPSSATEAGSGGADPGTAPLVLAVFSLVVLATFAALGVTQWLKHAPTAVQQLELSPATLSPGAAGEAGIEHIEFHIQHSDRIDVGVINSRGRTVSVLASGRWLRGYKRLTLSWDGQLQNGAYAPAGSYRLRIYLEQRKREVISPVSFEVRKAKSRA